MHNTEKYVTALKTIKSMNDIIQLRELATAIDDRIDDIMCDPSYIDDGAKAVILEVMDSLYGDSLLGFEIYNKICKIAKGITEE